MSKTFTPQTFTPKSEQELAELVAGATAPFRVQGLGSKPTLGNPVAAGQILSLRHFGGVEIYEPEELILEVGTATELSTVQKLLRQRGQMLAFEPPDYSSLFGTSSSGSLGGIVAAGLSGPRRIRAGAVRDHVLGFRGVAGNGERLKAGARVVKNVTGYDLAKLVTGSYGTLVAMTSVIVKVLPLPETEETIVFKGLDDAAAVLLMSEAMQSSADVSAAAHVPGDMTCLRLDGIAPSVAARRDDLIRQLGHDAGVLGERESVKLWHGIRDVKPFWSLQDHAIWRISVTPTQGAAVAAHLGDAMETKHFFDWAGGLIWLAVAGEADAGAAKIRASYGSGHATLMRAPASVRANVSALEPQAAALAALSRRVKQAFDPRDLFNPGIMVRG